MKTIKRMTGLLAVLLLMVSIQSCSNSQKRQEAKEAQKVIKKEIQQFAYPLPSMFELTEMLTNINAGYIVTLSNDPAKAKSYFSDKAKAINLGSYASDLAYAITYNSQAEVESYFQACEQLVRDLGFVDAFDKSLPEQIKSNINNREELVKIVTNMFEKSYSHLNEQGRTDISYLVLAGSVIEGLYLATNISENAYQNPEIVKTIISQKNSLLKLQELMQSYKDSDALKEAYADIAQINQIYAQTEGSTAMTKKQIEELTALVREARVGYVE
ncbi:MAG: hypothetical protein ACK5MI_09595 [Mangrovibacterium sp.]